MSFGALGLVEVLGAADGVVVLDKMCKTADVTFQARYTRNGGHDTVVVGGDVAAVTAAVQAATEGAPCEVIASAVISGPAEETMRVMNDWRAGKM